MSSCLPLADIKAFKGKGDAWALIQRIGADLRTTWRDMEALARESGLVTQSVAYIQVHRFRGVAREAAAVKELRWRVRWRDADRHVCWHEVEPLMEDQPIAIRRYFWQLNQRMLDLNCQGAILRAASMRLLGRMTDRSDPDIAAMFTTWINGQVSLADFDMRRPGFHGEDA